MISAGDMARYQVPVQCDERYTAGEILFVCKD